MKTFLTAVLAAAFGLNLSAAELNPKKLALGDSPLRVEISRDGSITHYLNGQPVFSLMLQVHWIHFAYQSRNLQIAMQGKDTLRSAGSVANIEFSSRTKLHSGRAETKYQLHLSKDNEFVSSKQWEVTPVFNMNTLKTMENCTFSATCVNGEKLSGNIRDIVTFPGRVRRFTIHNIQGCDLILEFPDGALCMDRRREAKSQGLWFFVPAVMCDGSYPQKAGDRAVLRFNAEVKESIEK